MTIPTIDDVLNFAPTSGSGASNDYVPDGVWRVALVEIGMPFQEASFNNPEEMVTKVRFNFVVAGTYDPATGEVQQSDYDGSRISMKVKADSNGPKSTKYMIASALLGQDLAQYAAVNGAPKPSDLIDLTCWAKVENKQGKKDPNKWYTELKWDSFTAQLPAHLVRPVPVRANAPVSRPAAPAQPAAQQPAAPKPNGLKF